MSTFVARLLVGGHNLEEPSKVLAGPQPRPRVGTPTAGVMYGPAPARRRSPAPLQRSAVDPPFRRSAVATLKVSSRHCGCTAPWEPTPVWRREGLAVLRRRTVYTAVAANYSLAG